jgi:hypothetical protein
MGHNDTDGDEVDLVAEELAAFETDPPWDSLDPGIAPLVRAFAALPGIRTVSSGDGHRGKDGDEPEWHIGWVLGSADPAASIIDAGPSADGWLTTEWLLWHANHLDSSDRGVYRLLSVVPPFYNFPGRAVTFQVRGALRGARTMTPQEYLGNLRDEWADTGHRDVDWP